MGGGGCHGQPRTPLAALLNNLSRGCLSLEEGEDPENKAAFVVNSVGKNLEERLTSLHTVN